MEGLSGGGCGMRILRLEALVADNNGWNGVVQGPVGGHVLVRLDLPGEGVWVDSTLHGEPSLVPFLRYNGMVVDGDVQTEIALGGRFVVILCTEMGECRVCNPLGQGHFDSSDGLG